MSLRTVFLLLALYIAACAASVVQQQEAEKAHVFEKDLKTSLGNSTSTDKRNTSARVLASKPGHGGKQVRESHSFGTFDVIRIDQAIDHATQYICNAANSNGMFNYEVIVEKGGKVKNKNTYNVLRHAGAIYSLVDSCYMKGSEIHQGEQQYCQSAFDTITSAANWLLREAIDPVPGIGLSAVYKPHRSHPKGGPDSIDRRLALGGQGLVMVALAGANYVQPGTVKWDLLEQVGNFTTQHLQKEDGTFYPFYIPFKAPFGVSEKPPSLYYPGEACLGLIYLYEAFKMLGEKKEFIGSLYLEAAARGLEGLANERESWRPEDIPFDHWALISTSKILKYLPPARHDKLLKHAASVTKVMHDRDMQRIAWDKELGVSSVATVLEAQFAMLPIFYDRPSYYDNVEQAWCLAEKTAFLLLEVQDRKKPKSMVGGLPHVVYLESDRKKVRSITGNNGRFRIDDTQHMLSAWLSYKMALASGLSNINCSKAEIPSRVDELFMGGMV